MMTKTFIKLFVCDIDGTLTDGIYHTTESGEISKNFFTRDFHGLWMLSKAGVKVCIITAASDDVIDWQCRRGAKYADVIKGTKDKLASIHDKYVDDLKSTTRFAWDEICYIGDDVFDVELLNKVGFAACPADADGVVLKKIREKKSDGFVSPFPGGKGCVRDFAEYVLEINKTGFVPSSRDGSGGR